MKKYFMMAFMAATALAFTACSNSDSDGGSAKKETTLQKVSTANCKMFSSLEGKSGTDEAKKNLPESLELTLHNEFVAHNEQTDENKGKILDLNNTDINSIKARKAGSEVNLWDFEWIIGKWSLEGSNYKLPGYAEIKVTNGADTNLTFKFNGSSEEVGAKATEETFETYTFQAAQWACRKWAVKQCRLEVTKDGKTQVTGSWDGCNLEKIANEIAKQVSYDQSKVAELTELGELKYIRFSPAGRTTFFFAGKNKNTVYYGPWTFKTDKTFTWDFEGTAGNDIIKGAGNGMIDFDGNDLALQMDAVVNTQYKGKIYFVLVPM